MILKPKNRHITKHFALSTNATNNVDIPAQEVTLEKNEPIAKIDTDSNDESSNEDDFPSRFSALINYFTGTSSTRHEISKIPDTKNDTNKIDKEKSSENETATETEFNAIVNGNEKISSFDKSTIHHTNNSDKNTKLQQIHNFVNQGTVDLLLLQTYLKIVENKQNKELADLKKHLFDISPINSVPKLIHETMEHQISDNIKNSDTESSSSSSDSSDSDDNDLTKQLKKALHIKTKNVKKKSPVTSKRTFEKKAFALAAKMIKNAARVKFQALKLDTDPKSTRLTFMYFIEDLSNLLDIFH